MENFSQNEAEKLILAGLQSNAIKLQGSHASKDAALEYAKNDAAYLLTLLNALIGKTPR